MISLLTIIVLMVINIIMYTFAIDNIFYSVNNIVLFFILPGYLLTKLLVNNSDRKEYLLSIPISISIAYLIGIILSLSSYFYGFTSPLTEHNLFIIYNIILFVLLFFSFKRKLFITLPNLYKYKNDLLFGILIIIGAYLGTTYLNNTGNPLIIINNVILLLIWTIIVVFKNNTKYLTVPILLFVSSISILFSVSVRSNFVSGWDINQEFRYFEQTKSDEKWEPGLYKDSYYSCLSITVLPVIINKITHLSGEIIFKLLFQVFFSITPVFLYFLYRKIENNFLSLISALFYIFQYQYLIQSSWIRQQIGFLFIVSFYLILFDEKVNAKSRKILLLVTGFSVVVSHYSSNYIHLIILLLAYLLTKVFNLGIIYNRKNAINNTLSSNIILLLFIFTLLWGLQVTNSAENVRGFFLNSVASMNRIFDEEVRAFNYNPIDTFSNRQTINYLEIINEYEENTNKDYYSKNLNFYESQQINQYRITYKPLYTSRFNIQYSYARYLLEFGNLIKNYYKLSIIICIFPILFLLVKKKRIDMFSVYAIVSFFVYILIVIIPYGTINYNISRLFQQLLILLSLPVSITALALFRFLKIKKVYLLVLIIFFLYSHGLAYRLIGGVDEFYNLSNNGSVYDEIYTMKGEKYSAVWLGKFKDNSKIIFADHPSSYRLLAYGGFFTIKKDVIPFYIYKDSYVYLRDANKNKSIGILPSEKYIQKIRIGYNFPRAFLNANKNIIYSNKSSIIYE